MINGPEGQRIFEAKLPVPPELAYLRLEHPEASLRELGELSTPPLSKSAVNHRMRKMLKLPKLLGREGKESSKPRKD